MDPGVAGSSPVDRPPLFFSDMTLWQAFILGLIQGITEFLPISSSGHLILAERLFGLENLQDYTLFNLTCHIGTLLAILIALRAPIKETCNPQEKTFWQILLATLPLFPIALFLKPLKSLFAAPALLGPCFLISAIFLFLGVYWKRPFSYLLKRPWQSALTVGVSQAVAIFPGISRSGATISTAKMIGWPHQEALRFSFLLAIPTILGGSLLEMWALWQGEEILIHISPWIFFIGFITSFLAGYASLSWLMRGMLQNSWTCFAWYCLLMAIAVTLYSTLASS